MQIVIATSNLAGVGGSETYAVTISDHLQRLGHDVWLYGDEHGRSSEAAERLGVRVARDEHDLPGDPDVLLVQDGAVACDLAARYPRTPQVFVAHSDIFDLQLPPQLPGLVAVVVALYDRVERRIRAMALPCEVVRLTQPIDVERFKPVRPLPERAAVAMTLSNYVHGERVEMLERACRRAGVELRHVGQYSAQGELPAARALDEADIVFGKARVIYEAMACGRAAYVFDHNGGEGWVTNESYGALSADNFGGQSSASVIDEDRLVADLGAYDSGMGLVNRDLAVSHHSATKHAAALADVLQRVAREPRAVSVDGPLREMARLIRLYHRADSQAFGLNRELERLHAELAGARAAAAADAAGLASRVAELERAIESERIGFREELDAARAEAAAARDELAAALDETVAARDEAVAARAEAAAARDEAAAAGGEAAEAEASAAAGWQAFDGLRTSRRWRVVQGVMSPADRLRGRRGARVSEPRTIAPAPFVVGVPRSGTTLLRFQLDGHPQLAIGPETGFGVVAPEVAARGGGPEDLLSALMALETWPDLGLDRDEAADVLARVTPWSVGCGLRALYTEFAAREGKSLWGDKTPVHLMHMASLDELLPEAHFIHLIRDGRGVAGSVRDLAFVPGDGSIEAIADDWCRQIEDARRASAAVAHYHEVRYERLVAEPEATLREICGVLELEFDPAMLRSHERAETRLAQLPETRHLGERIVTREDRRRLQADTLLPPDPVIADSWHEALSEEEIERFEVRAGDLLADLGYPLETGR